MVMGGWVKRLWRQELLIHPSLEMFDEIKHFLPLYFQILKYRVIMHHSESFCNNALSLEFRKGTKGYVYELCKFSFTLPCCSFRNIRGYGNSGSFHLRRDPIKFGWWKFSDQSIDFLDQCNTFQPNIQILMRLHHPLPIHSTSYQFTHLPITHSPIHRPATPHSAPAPESFPIQP